MDKSRFTLYNSNNTAIYYWSSCIPIYTAQIFILTILPAAVVVAAAGGGSLLPEDTILCWVIPYKLSQNLMKIGGISNIYIFKK